jgi:hypothetical protein
MTKIGDDTDALGEKLLDCPIQEETVRKMEEGNRSYAGKGSG